MLKKRSHAILTCDAVSNRKMASPLGYLDNVTDNTGLFQ
jgi:hypothetical protein